MNKQNIGPAGLAFTLAGSLLGAGYVSGQELWQYFGSYGAVGLCGLAISIALVGLVSALVFRLSDRAGTDTVDRLIIRFDIPWLRAAVGILFFLLYFAVAVIMIAGISSLGAQVFGIPRAVGSAAATALIMITVYFGFGGMVRVFGAAVPVLVLAAILLSVVFIADAGEGNIALAGTGRNPLLGPWYLSALNYTALNMFSSIGILAPLTGHFRKKRTVPLGIVIGTAILILIAVLLILAMAADPSSVGTDLPMLYAAQKLGRVPAGIYAALLFLAMYGNANATLVAALNWFDKRLPRGGEKKGRILRIAAVGVLAFVCSLTGFTRLVATVYPIIGYIGGAAVLLMAEHALHLAHKNRKTK